MTILESLLAISAYPIPVRTVMAYAAKRGIDTCLEVSYPIFGERGYRLVTADLMMWLYYAPNVSQGGQSYSLTDAQRADFRRRARAIYDELGDEEGTGNGIRYGYKGENV